MPPTNQAKLDHRYMTAAARLAIRGHGGAEPNPLVGCVIVSPEHMIVGWGYHRRFGGPHAEAAALKRAGARAKGATAYVTLEPCSHTGKTPPCTEALIAAGVSRVVVARRDPNPIAAGGVDRLRSAGIQLDMLPGCKLAANAADPFAHRVRSGLPWVMAKWAQTIDGRIATRTGQSQWISGGVSRRLVHRERGRVDAILTGVGTVLADDPQLTAREVTARRTARRVVIDPHLRTPLEAILVVTANETPTIIACDEMVLQSQADRAAEYSRAGVELLGAPMEDGEMPLSPVLRHLTEKYDATNVMVEAGASLIGRLFRQKLIREAWVFIAPLLLADEQAMPCATGMSVDRLTDGVNLKLISHRARGGDLVLRYHVES